MTAPFSIPHADAAVADFSVIERWWRDPAYRAECEQERVQEQARINALVDRGMASLKAAQEARWAAEHIAEGFGDD